MSTESNNEPRHEPGPATLGGILDDLRESDVTIPVDPSYWSSKTEGESITSRVTVPYNSLWLDDEDTEELGIEPVLTAHVTIGDTETVSLSTAAEAEADRWEIGGTVNLSPNAARQLAIQLLASAAVADRDSDDEPEGYLAE